MSKNLFKFQKIVVGSIAVIIALASVALAGLYPVITEAGFSVGGSGSSGSAGSYNYGGYSGSSGSGSGYNSGSYSSGGSSYSTGNYGFNSGSSGSYNYGSYSGGQAGSTDSGGSYNYGIYQPSSGASGSYNYGGYSGSSQPSSSSGGYAYGTYSGGDSGRVITDYGDFSYGFYQPQPQPQPVVRREVRVIEHQPASVSQNVNQNVNVNVSQNQSQSQVTKVIRLIEHQPVSQPQPAPNQPPIAVADISPTSGAAPLTVHFDCSRSRDPDGTIESCDWDFGDGLTLTQRSGTVIYENPGAFTVVLTVTDNEGAQDFDRLRVNVDQPVVDINDPPVAIAEINPTSGEEPLTVDFDCFDSYDPDGSIEECEWYFDDGSTSNRKSGTHTFNHSGTFNVRLTVTDNKGATDTDTVTVRVNEERQFAPEIVIFRVQSGGDLEVNQRVVFEIKACDQDSPQLEAEIDFDDGDRDRFTLRECDLETIFHRFDRAGTFQVDLQVEDEDGNRDTDRLWVDIERARQFRPVIEIFEPVDNRVNEDEQVRFRILVEDRDSEVLEARLNFDDGRQASFQVADGQIELIPHTYQRAGTYRPTLRVEDENGNLDFASTTVVVERDQIIVDKPCQVKCIIVQDPPPVGYTGPVDTKIYEIINGKKHWIPTAELVALYGYNFSEIQDVSFEFINSKERVRFLSPAGSDDIYYVTEDWKLRKFPTRQAFFSYGNSLSDVLEVHPKEIEAYEKVKYIHLDRDPTVYLLSADGKKHRLSQGALERLQLSSAQAAPVNLTEFNAYPTGAPVN